jgi:hypothetical protein
MIRPWYRSRLFWLGFPGLLFLLWAAGLAKSSWPSYSYVSATQQVIAGWNHRKGMIVCVRPISVPRVQQGFRTFPYLMEYPWITNVPGWPPPFASRRTEDSWNGFVAAWSLLPCYLGVWLTMTMWWQRRKARLVKASAAPLP